MSSSVVSTPCIHCGTEVTLTSPHGASQAVPTGMCPKCKQSYYVSYDLDGGMQVNAYSGQHITREAKWAVKE